MHSTPRTSMHLDEFIGLCAFGHLSSAAITVPDAPWRPKFTGTAHWDQTEYRLESWVGPRDLDHPGPDTEGSVWLTIQDEILDVSAGDLEFVPGLAPEDFAEGLSAAANQLLAMMKSGFRAIATAYDAGNQRQTIEQLHAHAATVQPEALTELEIESAHLALMNNCLNTLLGRVRLQEAQNSHLAYDVHAVTLDPQSDTLAEIGIGWIAGDNGPEHSYVLSGRECPAHSGAGADAILEGMDEKSREHYLHTFNHLHQIADAADRYSIAQRRLAIAETGTLDDPLGSDDRHRLSHMVHTAAAEHLSAYLLEWSGEPSAFSGEHPHR